MKTIELVCFFEKNGFGVYEFEQDKQKCAELEMWTDGGVDMIITLMPFSKATFIEYVNGFNIDDEITNYRQDKKYCDAFTIKESVEDFTAFHEKLKGIVTLLNGDVPTVKHNPKEVYNNLKEAYNKLEEDVKAELKKIIGDSKIVSKHIVGCPCIKVNVFDYTELVFWDDRLTFVDEKGLHYDLLSECTLEDLIDILNVK